MITILIINQKKNLPAFCHFLFHSKVLEKYSPESSGLKLEIKFKCICSFILAGSGSETNDSGCDRIRIHNTVLYNIRQYSVRLGINVEGFMGTIEEGFIKKPRQTVVVAFCGKMATHNPTCF